MRYQCLDGIKNVAQVRLTIAVQRRRYADDQRVSLRHARKIDCGLESFCKYISDRFLGNMLDITLSQVQFSHLVGIDIEPDYLEACIRIAQQEGQADITKTHNTDDRGPGLDLFDQLVQQVRLVNGNNRIQLLDLGLNKIVHT